VPWPATTSVLPPSVVPAVLITTLPGTSGADAAPSASLASTSVVTGVAAEVWFVSSVAVGMIGVTVITSVASALWPKLSLTRYGTAVAMPLKPGSGSKVAAPVAGSIV